MPLADVMTFYMATPLIITALSAPLLGEKVERFRWIAVLVGFVGVLIALRPSPQMLSWAAPIALFGAIAYALSQTITRDLRGIHWVPLVLWQFVGTGLVGAATIPWAWTTPSLFDLGLMFLVGVVAMICIICVVRALGFARVAVLAPLQYTALLWAAILGWLIWRDVPTIVLIWPAFAAFPGKPVGDPVNPPTAVKAFNAGTPKLAWLKILKTSARNWVFSRSKIFVSFESEKSVAT
jgi:S-adenosylmethionine uptake transporter